MCYRLSTIDISTEHMITCSCYMFMIWLIYQKVEAMVVVELQARGLPSQSPHICNSKTFTFLAFSRCFCPRRLTVIHAFIHTLMAVAAIQGADQHIKSSLGFVILPKDTSKCRPGESNQQASQKRHWLCPWATAPTTTIPLDILMKTSENF